MPTLDFISAINGANLTPIIGRVKEIRGLAIVATGPRLAIGSLCYISDENRIRSQTVLAEVVGINGNDLTLMAYDSVEGLAAGASVIEAAQTNEIIVGETLLGRVIDAFGEPLDSKPAPITCSTRSLKAVPSNPLTRPRISDSLPTGVTVIDCLLTMGKGQRIGIFAGSGVGKSTLLGLMAGQVNRNNENATRSSVNVIALIGERGREVRDFIEQHLTQDILPRTVIVVATADQPALVRVRATYAALTIAEYFRDLGKDVLFTMDSMTRFAMAKREIGLSAGEPPTARGYTPSVFAELPRICERCGTSESGGAISALLTVLVEGDDLNEPISDALRAILDGHIVLSRDLANQGQYPAIDVLRSVSRLMPELLSKEQLAVAAAAKKKLALLSRNKAMVEAGAYDSGSNPELDSALKISASLFEWCAEVGTDVSSADRFKKLSYILQNEV
jgi:flagellum-specific ATP synthase